MMLRSVTIAATLALIANAASAAPPLEGVTGYFVLGMYRHYCNPPSPTVAQALMAEKLEKFKDLTQPTEEGSRQVLAMLNDLGTVRFCREVAAALKEPSSVADAQAQVTLLGQLDNLKTRYAAARGNSLLQESIVKQRTDTLCVFFQTYRFVEEWSGSLAAVSRSSGDFIDITIQLGGEMTSSSLTNSSSFTDIVAAMMPGTRVRFSGSLFGACGDVKDRFIIILDRITQDK